MMSSPGRAACLLLALASVAACGKVAANSPGAMPALQIPTPDARMVIPVSIEVPPPPVVVEPPPPAAADPASAAPARGAKPPATPLTASTTSPPTPEPTTTPAPTLQPGENVSVIAKQARERLDTAERGLGAVNRQTLGTDTRAQFDNAERFVRMAKGALEVHNYVYALYCADKAATLARLLVKREPAPSF